MRLPAPLIAATGSLVLALSLAVIPGLVAGPSTVQAQDVPTVELNLDEWSITPSDITIPVNQTVRFTLANVGTTNTHELAIAGFGEELHSETAAIGETVSFDVKLSTPGVYKMWCPRGGGSHEERGMVGSITVTSADQGDVMSANQGSAVEVPVEVGEFYFEPGSLSTVAGQTTRFQITDAGAINHVMVVESEDGTEMRSPTVRPGEPVTWEVTFDTPGTYEVYCSFNVQGVLHKDLGMVATLDVLPAAM
jgi:plastocyanin